LPEFLQLFLCFLFFRKEIPKKILVSKKINPSDFIRSKVYSLIGIVLLILMFVTLLGSEFLGFEIWKVTLSFAFVFLILNLYFGFIYRTNQKRNDYQLSKTKNILNKEKKLGSNEFFIVLYRCPYKIFPLIVVLFIMIHLFMIYGITDFVTGILNTFSGIFSGTIFVSFLSAIMSNIMINQPMTLLFANAMQGPLYSITGVAQISHGLGLIIDSNLGGNLTIYGALAGLMWTKILKNNGVKFSLKDFLKYSLKIVPLVILLTSLALTIQMRFFY